MGERLQAVARTLNRCATVVIFSWLLVWLLLFLLDKFGFEEAVTALYPLFAWLSFAAVAGAIAFPVSRKIARWARRVGATVINSPDDLRGQEYVLYLRSFAVDAQAYRCPTTVSRDPSEFTMMADSDSSYVHELTMEEELVDA